MQKSGEKNRTKEVSNSEKALESGLKALQVPTSDSSRCQLEEEFLRKVVEKVISVSQIKCKRKKKLVKLWHKPKPGESQVAPQGVPKNKG